MQRARCGRSQCHRRGRERIVIDGGDRAAGCRGAGGGSHSIVVIAVAGGQLIDDRRNAIAIFQIRAADSRDEKTLEANRLSQTVQLK